MGLHVPVNLGLDFSSEPAKHNGICLRLHPAISHMSMAVCVSKQVMVRGVHFGKYQNKGLVDSASYLIKFIFK